MLCILTSCCNKAFLFWWSNIMSQYRSNEWGQYTLFGRAVISNSNDLHWSWFLCTLPSDRYHICFWEPGLITFVYKSTTCWLCHSSITIRQCMLVLFALLKNSWFGVTGVKKIRNKWQLSLKHKQKQLNGMNINTVDIWNSAGIYSPSI